MGAEPAVCWSRIPSITQPCMPLDARENKKGCAVKLQAQAQHPTSGRVPESLQFHRWASVNRLEHPLCSPLCLPAFLLQAIWQTVSCCERMEQHQFFSHRMSTARRGHEDTTKIMKPTMGPQDVLRRNLKAGSEISATETHCEI